MFQFVYTVMIFQKNRWEIAYQNLEGGKKENQVAMNHRHFIYKVRFWFIFNKLSFRTATRFSLGRELRL